MRAVCLSLPALALMGAAVFGTGSPQGQVPPVFAVHCAACHGPEGLGTAQGPALAMNQRVADRSADQLAAYIQHKPQPTDLKAISLEDLMNIEITSASRKEQRASDVPAALYVITQDEIRRSGMTTIPELLRLAPGMDVARVNASSWAVTARGFGDRA